MSQIISVEKAHADFLFLGKFLDENGGELDEALIYNKELNPDTFFKIHSVYDFISNKYFTDVKRTLPSEVSEYSNHFETKINQLKRKLDLYKNKLVTTQPAGITVPYERFTKSIPPAPQPLNTISPPQQPIKQSIEVKQEVPQAPRIYKPISFKIEQV